MDHDSAQELTRRSMSRLGGAETLSDGGALCLRVTRPSSPSISPWMTRTAGRGAMGFKQQATGNRKYRQHGVQLEAAAGSRGVAEKSGCWVGAHGLERRSCGWVWQHNSGDYQIEQQREAAKLVGSIASSKNRRRVEARAD